MLREQRMLYWLVKTNLNWLEDHNLGFLRVFTFVTFQAVVSIVTSFVLSIALGPKVIGWLQRHKLGDLSKFDQADMDRMMANKQGTPTMGGLLIIFAITITTLLLADLRNFYVQMGLVCLLGMGAIGAADDWLKLTAGRRNNSRQGLEGPEKLIGQVGLALVLAYFTFRHGREVPVTHQLFLPF